MNIKEKDSSVDTLLSAFKQSLGTYDPAHLEELIKSQTTPSYNSKKSQFSKRKRSRESLKSSKPIKDLTKSFEKKVFIKDKTNLPAQTQNHLQNALKESPKSEDILERLESVLSIPEYQSWVKIASSDLNITETELKKTLLEFNIQFQMKFNEIKSTFGYYYEIRDKYKILTSFLFRLDELGIRFENVYK